MGIFYEQKTQSKERDKYTKKYLSLGFKCVGGVQLLRGLQFFEKASLARVPRPTDKVVEDKAPSKILGKVNEGKREVESFQELSVVEISNILPGCQKDVL